MSPIDYDTTQVFMTFGVGQMDGACPPTTPADINPGYGAGWTLADMRLVINPVNVTASFVVSVWTKPRE
jgi:hypothetical protein